MAEIDVQTCGGPQSRGWLALAVPLALAVAVAAIYGQTLGFEFVNFDDNEYVVNNPTVRQGLSLSGVRWAMSSMVFANWHPLTWMSHQLDCSLYGLRAGGHHLTNVVLHLLAAWLLFAFLSAATGDLWPSALVAALFAVHPLHVESVAWISERKDVLSACLWMATLLAYLRYGRGETRGWYLAVVVGFGLGLMAKPMVITLPCVLLLLDVWPLRRVRWRERGWDREAAARAVRLVLEKAPLLLLSALSAAATLIAQSRGGAVKGFAACPPAARLGNAVLSYGWYLRKALWPTDLAVFYPHPGADLSWVSVAATAVGLAAVTGIAAMQWRRHPYLAVGWCWYLGVLVPVIGLVQIGAQAHADRYAYLPLIGIWIAAAWSGQAWLRRRPGIRPVAAAAATAAVLALAVTAHAQVRHWRNSRALFERALACSGPHPTIYNNLGAALAAEGALTAALACYKRSLELEYQPMTLNNLGDVYCRLNRPRAALPYLREAVRLQPRDWRVAANLGVAFSQAGAFDRASLALSKARELAPEQPFVHNALGLLRIAQGDSAAAEQAFREALRQDPAHLPSLRNQIRLYRDLGRQEEAAEAYRQLLRWHPDDSEAGSVLKEQVPEAELQNRKRQPRADPR